MSTASQINVLTMAAQGTTTNSIDLKQIWKEIYLEVPTMASASDFYIQGSTDDSTFRRIMQPVPVTTSVQAYDFRIASTVTNRMIPIPANFQFYKIEASTANTAALEFNFVCK